MDEFPSSSCLWFLLITETWVVHEESMEQKCIYNLHFYVNLKSVDFFQQLSEFFFPKEKK